MLAQILDWITNVGLLFLVAAVIIWGVHYSKLPKSLKLLGIYLLANLIIQIAADLLWRNRMNNLPLLHLNTFLEFVLLSFFFKEIYLEQHLLKKYFKHFVLSGALLLILNSVFLESIYYFNSNAKVFVQLILITYVVIYFFDAFGKVDFSQIDKQAISFISFAILFYYAGSLFIFMFKRSSFSTAEIIEEYRIIWIINGILTAIFQLIVLISIGRVAYYNTRATK